MMKAQIVKDLILKGLIEMGATPAPENNFGSAVHYALMTRYGLFTIGLHEPKPMRGQKAIYSCYGRFENSKDNPRCSPYSGKYNWHQFAKDLTPESFAEFVLQDIRSMLPEKS